MTEGKFEPTISTCERPQSYVLDRAATGAGSSSLNLQFKVVSSLSFISNIYPTRSNVTQFILSGNCPSCFGWYIHPPSGAQTTVSTASGICHAVTAICRFCERFPIIRSANNCIYSIWYLLRRYCYLPLS